MSQKAIREQELSLIDPKEFGLSSRIKIGQRTDKELYVLIDRKSRIIMKDGKRIEKIVEILKKSEPRTSVALATTAAVCSKTTAYLTARGISIKQLKTK